MQVIVVINAFSNLSHLRNWIIPIRQGSSENARKRLVDKPTIQVPSLIYDVHNIVILYPFYAAAGLNETPLEEIDEKIATSPTLFLLSVRRP